MNTRTPNHQNTSPLGQRFSAAKAPHFEAATTAVQYSSLIAHRGTIQVQKLTKQEIVGQSEPDSCSRPLGDSGRHGSLPGIHDLETSLEIDITRD
jgi:hypothetical protein